MAWVYVDYDGDEFIRREQPRRSSFYSEWLASRDTILLPKGSIKKLIGRELTWNDAPVDLEEEENEEER